MALPVFYGEEEEDAYWWILCVEKIFKEQRTRETLKIVKAITSFRGRALQWWIWRSQYKPLTNWDSFTTVFLFHFKPDWREILPIEDEEEQPHLDSTKSVDETSFHEEFVVEQIPAIDCDLKESSSSNLYDEVEPDLTSMTTIKKTSCLENFVVETVSSINERVVIPMLKPKPQPNLLTYQDEETKSVNENSPSEPPPVSIFDPPPVPPPPLNPFCYEENVSKNISPVTYPATFPTISSMISQMKSHATKTSASLFLQESPYQCLPNEFINLSPLCNVEKKHPTVQLKPATRLLHFNHTRPTRLLPVGRPSAHSPIFQKGSFLSFENNHPPLHFPQFMQNSSQPFIQKNVPPIAIVITCSSISPLTSIQQDFLSLHTISHSHTNFGQKNVASHPGTSCPMSSTAYLPHFTYQFLKANFNQPHQFGFHKSTNTVSTLAPNSINLQTVHYHSSSLFPSMINKSTKTNFMFPMMLVPFKNTKNEPVLSPDTKIHDHKRDCYEQAFKCFRKMQIVGVVYDYVIIMAIIFVGAHLGALGLGLCVHRFARKKGFRDNVRVSNSLANICVPYGCMKLALKVFDRMTQQILGLGNSIIDSFTQNEFVDEVLSSFYLMRKEEFESNGVLSIEDIHEEVVALIPTFNFSFENIPMNNTESIMVLVAHSLTKIIGFIQHHRLGHMGASLSFEIDYWLKINKRAYFAWIEFSSIFIGWTFVVLILIEFTQVLLASENGFIAAVRQYVKLLQDANVNSNSKLEHDDLLYVSFCDSLDGSFSVIKINDPWLSLYTVYDIVLKSVRKQYIKLGERQVVQGSRVARLFYFLHMTCLKLKRDLNYGGFEYCFSSKLVLEALYSIEEVRHRQRSPCMVNLDPKCFECEIFFLIGQVYFQVFSLCGQEFFLSTYCNINQQSSFHCFGLFLGMHGKGLVSFTVAYVFVPKSRLKEEFLRTYKGKYTFTYAKAFVYRNMSIDYANFAVGCGFTNRVFSFRLWDPGKVAIRFLQP